MHGGMFWFFPETVPKDIRSVIKVFVARFGWKPEDIRNMTLDDIALCIEAYEEDAQREISALEGLPNG